MSSVTRRTFMKLVGGGTAALGLGMTLPNPSWAKAEGKKEPADEKWSEWEFYYPGEYDAKDTKILKDFMAACKMVEDKGEIDIDALVSGKLAGKVGIGRTSEVTASSIEEIDKANVGDNPLFMDKEYVKKTKYGKRFAFPMLSSWEVMPAMVKDKGFADHIVVSSHNDVNSYYEPFYEGDTLYQVVDYQRCWDITPPKGAITGPSSCAEGPGSSTRKGGWWRTVPISSRRAFADTRTNPKEIRTG